MRRYQLALAAAFCGAISVASAPAHAITCEGNFQVQRNGSRISTPYCQDDRLAVVAREYGMRADAETIRYNPSEKERVCRFVGDDNRVRDTCVNYRSDGRRRLN